MSESDKDGSVIDQFVKISDFARKEVASVHSTYKLYLGIIAGVLVLFAALFFTLAGKTESENKLAARERMDFQMAHIQDSLNDQFIRLSGKVEDRVDEELRKDNIETLVKNEAQIRIDEIADPLINQKIAENLLPRIQLAQNQITRIQLDLLSLKDAKTAATERMDFQMAHLRDSLNDQLVQLSKQLVARVEDAFRKDNIEALVKTKASMRIDEIADPIVNKRITEGMLPKIQSAENQMAKIQKNLSTIRDSKTAVKEQVDFQMAHLQDSQNVQFARLGKQLETRISEGLRKETIEALVYNKARTRIDEIADSLINKKMAESQITKIQKDLSIKKDTVIEAQNRPLPAF